MNLQHSVALGMTAALLRLTSSNALPVDDRDAMTSLSRPAGPAEPATTISINDNGDAGVQRRSQETSSDFATVDMPGDHVLSPPASSDEAKVIHKRASGAHGLGNFCMIM